MKHTIGVVIPVYNTDGIHLDECISSAVSQTHSGPVVVVDDASQNADTLAVLARWSDRGIRVLRHPRNLGVSAARNTGIDALDTEFVFLLDADDRILPHVCEIVADQLSSDPSIAILTFDQRHFGRFSAVDRTPGAPNGTPDLIFNNSIPIGSGFRRSGWIETGGFATDLHYGEDWDFWIRLLALGGRTVVVHEPLYEYRHHTIQVTNTISEEAKYEQHMRIVSRNAALWSPHIEMIMARYFRLQDEHARQGSRLRAFEQRYGRINELLKRGSELLGGRTRRNS